MRIGSANSRAKSTLRLQPLNTVLGGMTNFIQLSNYWNAEPNDPDPTIEISGSTLTLRFNPNPFLYPEYEKITKIALIFRECKRYRLGPTNDEGWYHKQCRFSGIAPKWGEFYEVQGDLKLDQLNDKWHELSGIKKDGKHFLFYFRDNTFECDATSWTKENED
ncbi:MAG: hypothetical protein NXI26_27460 [bacterium]|nr:hypothetical protein [bacterium]